MEALAQRLNLDTNALAMRVKANASMVAAKASKAAQLAEEADDWWAGTAATAQNLEDALERGKREVKQGQARMESATGFQNVADAVDDFGSDDGLGIVLDAGHVEDDAEANAGADAPADVEPLAQTEILQSQGFLFYLVASCHFRLSALAHNMFALIATTASSTSDGVCARRRLLITLPTLCGHQERAAGLRTCSTA